MKRQILVATLVCGLCTLSSTATAKVNFEAAGLFKNGGAEIKAVSSKKLSTMRGKFVRGTKVVKFGVEMVSTWKLQNGQVLTAGSQLIVDRVSGNVTFKPMVTITNGTETLFANSTVGTIIGNGHLNASGVVQSIRIAADDNKATQSITMDIFAGGSFVGSDFFKDVPEGTTQTVSLDGATAQAFLNSQGVGVNLTTEGHGSVMQAIRGGNSKGLLQSVRLVSNNNEVQSMMRVHIELVRGSSRPIMSTTARVIQSISQHQGI